MNFVFEGTERMGDAFFCIGERVGEVVHRVDAPVVLRAVVVVAADAVHHRVAHEQVRVSHVDLGADGLCAVGKLTGPHAGKEVEVLLNGAVAVRAVLAGGRLGDVVFVCNGGAAVNARLLLGKVVNVGVSLLDDLYCQLVEVLVIVRSVKLAVPPIVAHPPHIALDGLHVGNVLFFGIRVVKAEVALAPELLCH